jgi:TolB-like protein/Flp pilus assembly protein TadD
VEITVETAVESAQWPPNRTPSGLVLRLLGPVSVVRDGVTVDLPASRKVLALMAYLALAPAPVPRSRICDLLWDVANDPRGELRWCLSKLRKILDAPGRKRVAASRDRLALDLEDCFVDARALAEADLDTLDVGQLQALASLCDGGDFLEGLMLDRSPQFDFWLAEQRQRFAARRAAIADLLPPHPSVFATAASSLAEPRATVAQRASLAVMPLRDESADNAQGGVAAGLTYDIITRLAKLRHFFVIAQGSVFALDERRVGRSEAGHRLDVDYVAGGSVCRRKGRIVVAVELIETRTGRLVWAETFDREIDDLFAVLHEIGDSIVASIAAEIEMAERNCAILKPPSSLNAWEAYHRGLWHMYRFTKEENAAARHFFDLAIRLDPTFSRAHAGLSFTHWQNAFQSWEDRGREADLAYDTAGRSLMVDDRDPVAHWAMGRALWLRGRHDDSLVELRGAVDLSPNFALGHYALSFVQSQAGDPRAAIQASDQARHLSPFDPLLFGMLNTRALALVRLGEFEEAAEWSSKAAARPNAHANILASAAYCLALAGRLEEARAVATLIHKTRPSYRADDFLTAFQFAPADAALFREGARRIGLD